MNLYITAFIVFIYIINNLIYLYFYCRSMSNISTSTKRRCIKLREQGNTYVSIQKATGLSEYKVRNILYLVNPRVSSDSEKVGRPLKIEKNLWEELRQIFLENEHLGVRLLVDIVEDQLGICVHFTTLSEYANRLDLIWALPKVQISITALNIQKRLDWARLHSNYDFKCVIFSDESHMRVGISQYCRQDKYNRKTIKNNKWSGEVRIWWAISYTKLHPPIFYDKTLDSKKYCDKILTPFFESKEFDGIDDYVFQQDNATCHKSKYTIAHLMSLDVNLMPDWPPQSPDLNPIENAWAIIKRRAMAKKPESADMLLEAVKEVIADWKIEESQKLIESMHMRVKQVIANDGHKIKY